MSNVFKDARGRAWELSLTYGDVRRVNRLLGLNLTKMADRQLTEEDLKTVEFKELPPFMQLQADSLLLVDVLYAILQPQADKRSVTDEEFGSSLTPEIFKAASEIFWRLYYDFFLESGEPIKAKMIQGVQKLSNAVQSYADDVDAKIQEILDQAEKEMSTSSSTS